MSPYRTGRTFSNCLILLHFILNQCVAILVACLANIRIGRLDLHNLLLICRISSFLSLLLSLAVHNGSRGFGKKTAFSQIAISKTDLVYNHAKTCLFYPLNRLPNCMQQFVLSAQHHCLSPRDIGYSEIPALLLAFTHKANLSIACYNSMKAKLQKKFQSRALALVRILNLLKRGKKLMSEISAEQCNVFRHICLQRKTSALRSTAKR